MVVQYGCQMMTARPILLIFKAFLEIRNFLKSQKVTFLVTRNEDFERIFNDNDRDPSRYT